MYCHTPSSLVSDTACPNCKLVLHVGDTALDCAACGQRYPLRPVPGRPTETFADFRIHYPEDCAPPNHVRWRECQEHFEKDEAEILGQDILDHYEAESEMFRPAYEGDFAPTGRILDVGGHQGRLRLFIPGDERRNYVNLDPYPEVFFDLAQRTNLLQAFPPLRDPCPFVAGEAERLPFPAESFDTVHIRSAIDHFADPYLALLEAHRVLTPTGRLVVATIAAGGLSVIAAPDAPATARLRSLARRAKNKHKREGVRALIQSGLRTLVEGDPHLYHWTHSGLSNVIDAAGFDVTAELWLPSPNDSVLFMLARPRRGPTPYSQEKAPETLTH